MKIWSKRWFKVTVSLLITLLAIWLSFRRVDWEAFLQVVSRLRWEWAVVALANVIFSVYLMGWRWQVLLKPKAFFSLYKLFQFNMVSQYWNIILPARAGDVVKAYLVGREKSVPGGFAVGTVVLEKFMDFFVFGFLLVTLPFFVAVERNWWPPLTTSLFILAIFVAGVGIIFFNPSFFLKLVEFFSKFLPLKFKEPLYKFFASGLESFSALKKPQMMIALLVFSFAFVVVQAFSNYFVFLALGLNLSVAAAVVVLVALQVINIAPSSPGKIGVFEYVVILTLAFYGVDKASALGYAILLHLIVYLPKILAGGIFQATEGIVFPGEGAGVAGVAGNAGKNGCSGK